MKLVLFYSLCAFVAKFYISAGFDVVSLETGFDNDGVVAAFGDYNGDKLVDVFVINPSGMYTHSVYHQVILQFNVLNS